MRPVRRDASPAGDFDPYTDARPHLISRIGRFCSYCERPILTSLAVEHIQPKGLAKYKSLECKWNNFLLGCVNCNSTKKDKDVILSDCLLPDRDNTAFAYTYTPDGMVAPSLQAQVLGLSRQANATLILTGLDKKICTAIDENGKQVAIDRISQRMEAWATAEVAKVDLANEDTPGLRKCITKLALSTGFFSIWMTVFEHDVDMRRRFVDIFPGTMASGCFDPVNTKLITPAPNPDMLADGGKL